MSNNKLDVPSISKSDKIVESSADQPIMILTDAVLEQLFIILSHLMFMSIPYTISNKMVLILV